MRRHYMIYLCQNQKKKKRKRKSKKCICKLNLSHPFILLPALFIPVYPVFNQNFTIFPNSSKYVFTFSQSALHFELIRFESC